MTELGKLEAAHEKFEAKKARVVVVSLEDLAAAGETQNQFPHLLVLADPDEKMTGAMHGIHPHSSPTRDDSAAPTTIIIDGKGTVRWVKRPERHIARPPPEEVLQALDQVHD